MLSPLVVGVGREALELEEYLSEALGKSGVAGTIGVAGVSAILEGNGPTVTIDVTSLLTQWPLLTPEQRKRRAAELARRFATDRRRLSGTERSSTISMPSFVAPVAILLATAAAIGVLWSFYQRWLHARELAEHPPVIKDYDAYEKERSERAARVCAATRTRVLRGAAVGPSDAEGWVVELNVLRAPSGEPPSSDPALARFFERAPGSARGHVRSPNFPALSALEGPDTEVVVSDSNVPVIGAPHLRGATFAFSGRYVAPYFDDASRAEFIALARGVTDALGGTHAALYARCASGTSPHLGSWFRGPNAGGALASLLYFVGVFSDPPDLRTALLVPPGASGVDRGFSFKNVLAATQSLKKARAVTLLAPELGALSGTDDQASTLTFPFRDSNRASRASHGIARELGIGDGR